MKVPKIFLIGLLLFLLTVVFVLLFGLVWWKAGTSPQVVEFVNGTSSSKGWLPSPDIKADAGVAVSSSSFGKGSSFQADNYHVGNFSRIALFARDTNKSTFELGMKIAQLLSKHPGIESVSFYPAGLGPERGSKAAGIFFLISAEEVALKNWLVVTESQWNVSMKGGTGVFPPNRFYGGLGHLPWQPIQWSGSGQFTSSFTGVRLGSSRQASLLAASEMVTKQITDDLQKWREKAVSSDRYPSGFHPDFVEAPSFDFLKDFGAQNLLAVRNFLIPNHSVWTFTSQLPTKAIYDRIVADLEQEDWKILQREEEPHPVLRLVKEDRRYLLEIYPEEDSGEPVEEVPKEETTSYFVQFTSTVPIEEQTTLLNELMQDPQTDGVLLTPFLDRIKTKEEAMRILSVLKGNLSVPPKQLLSLSKRALDGTLSDDALLHAYWAHVANSDSGDFQQVLESVEREFPSERLRKMEWWDPELLRSFHWVDLSRALPDSRIEVVPGQRMFFFHPELQNEFQWAELGLDSPGGSGHVKTGKVSLRKSGDRGSSSWMSSNFDADATKVTRFLQLGDAEAQIEPGSVVLSYLRDAGTGHWTLEVSEIPH